MENTTLWIKHIKQQLSYNNNMYAEFPMLNSGITYNHNLVIYISNKPYLLKEISKQHILDLIKQICEEQMITSYFITTRMHDCRLNTYCIVLSIINNKKNID